MIKKVLKFTLPIILLGSLMIIAFNTYKKANFIEENPISVIPENASLILQLNDIKKINKTLHKNKIWNNLNNLKFIASINNEVNKYTTLLNQNENIFKTNSLCISFHKVSEKKAGTLFSTIINKNYSKNSKEFLELFDDDIIQSSYDNKTIYYSHTNGIYLCSNNNILFFSKDKMLITDAIRTSNKNTDDLFSDPSFTDCYQTINNFSDINLLINYNNLIEFSNIFLKSKFKISHFSGWAATDLKIKENAILASGFSANNNKIDNYSSLFKQQSSKKIKIYDYAPENTNQLFAITFDNNKDFYEKKKQYLQNKNKYWSWEKNKLLIQNKTNFNLDEFIYETEGEAGFFNTSSNLSNSYTFNYFKTKESIRASSLLQEMIIYSLKYKDFIINQISDKNLTANLFGEIFITNNSFFTIIDDFFIFGNSEASIKYIIDKNISKNTLSTKKSFNRFNSFISKDANIFCYLNLGKTANILMKNMNNSELFGHNSDSIAKITALSLQIKKTKNKMLHNLCLFYDEDHKENIKEEWYLPLDTTVLMKPQFIYNHFTKERNILIQDNRLNLISLNSSGEKIWSKKFNQKILGNINFIDFYNNNKFQALLNTSNKLYLIDRNGENVDGFPINLPTSTYLGHSLIDYDNNRKYRILITGIDNKIYNIDKSGKQVKGWKYKVTENLIIKPPVHFTVKKRDYILNATNNSSTKLLARNGSNRTRFSDIKSFTNTVKISEKGILYAITDENSLWTANVEGITKISKLQKLEINSKILAFNDGYYIANGNTLSFINKLNDHEKTLSLNSNINSIEVFNEFIVISTISSLYLIKENKICEGFPIDSDGYFNLSDIDNNSKINVVNINNGFIYNYELVD